MMHQTQQLVPERQKQKTHLRLAIDLDGVLADFNLGFKDKLFITSGKRLIPRDEEPKCWSYPTEYGYTKEEETKAWEDIKQDCMFWAMLQPEVGALSALMELAQIRAAGHEVYFLTTRLGIDCHQQSQFWLHNKGFVMPTVLISRGNKGQLCQGLGITHLIDDKPENILDVQSGSPQTKAFLLSRRWNKHCHLVFGQKGLPVVTTIQEFLRKVSEDAKSE